MQLIDQLIALLSNALLGALTFVALLLPTLEPIRVEPPVVVSEFPAAAQQEEEKPVADESLAQGLPIAASGDRAAGQTEDPRGLSATQVSPPPPKPTKTETQINEEARAALVNVYCSSQQGVNGVSGSGIVVDSRGIILTNAHVAQYFLLRDYRFAGNVECVVRTGSPAEPRYTAELLYLPPAWMAANASQIAASQALGTGEHDYAFLRITGRTDGSALPSSFAALKMDGAAVDIGDAMLLAAYPAGFLGGETVLKNLYASSAVAYVTRLFNFGGDAKQVDLFSIGGSVVSQGGSSGGAAVRLSDGTLAGLIALATVATETGKRDLRALSLGHIDASLRAQGEGGVATLLSQNPAFKASSFNTSVAPGLRQQLLNYLPK